MRTTGKLRKTDLFYMQAYHGLPCALEKFTIRDKDADDTDFGEGGDQGERGEPYTCTDHRFIANRCPKHGVLEKYGITREEYDAICDALEDVLYVGSCGWCV